MAEVYIKPEIKPDPDAPGASPAAFSEDDIYEDAGDLEFNTDPDFQNVILAKVPKYVWEAWSKLDDDAEIQIGTIRVMQGVDHKTNLPKQKTGMLLSSNLAYNQQLPREYDLETLETNVSNTFMFTEQDLPGFKSKSKQKFEQATANMPSRISKASNKAPASVKTPYDPNKKWTPFFKKAIPKRCTVAGRVQTEVNCVVVENQQSSEQLKERTLRAMRPKAATKYFGKFEDVGASNGVITPGMVAAVDKWGGFIKNTGPANTAKKPQTQKTARIPQNELMDKLFACFNQYKYWSLKALRQHLQQPEAYLKETLERIAILHRSGSFSAHYSLKQENQMGNYVDPGQTMAPEAAPGSAGDFEDDLDEDGDTLFENAL